MILLQEEMTEVYGIEITSNVMDTPYEKKYLATMTLADLKKKLELVVGATAENLKVQLFTEGDQGTLVGELHDDQATLQQLGVRDGMRIHCIDRTGGNELLSNGAGEVEKYVMDDNDYDKREDSVRAYLKRLAEAQGGASPMPAQSGKGEEEQSAAAAAIDIGARCEVRVNGQPPRRGKVAFNGLVGFKAGVWIGVLYDEPVGKNDGSVAGKRYFSADPKYGGFVRPLDVAVGDFPELSIDDDLDEI